MAEFSSSYKRCVKAVLLSHLRLRAAQGQQLNYAPLIQSFTILFTFFTHAPIHHAPGDPRSQCQTSRWSPPPYHHRHEYARMCSRDVVLVLFHCLHNSTVPPFPFFPVPSFFSPPFIPLPSLSPLSSLHVGPTGPPEKLTRAEAIAGKTPVAEVRTGTSLLFVELVTTCVNPPLPRKALQLRKRACGPVAPPPRNRPWCCDNASLYVGSVGLPTRLP